MKNKGVIRDANKSAPPANFNPVHYLRRDTDAAPGSEAKIRILMVRAWAIEREYVRVELFRPGDASSKPDRTDESMRETKSPRAKFFLE